MHEADKPSPAKSCVLHVLYVEDNRINALLFDEALRSLANVQLSIAEDAPEALATVKAAPPDVLVIDGHLPSMTGHDLLTQIRRLPHMQAVPAFMCSADNLPEHKQRALDVGFTGYWDKPIDIDEVTQVLSTLAAQKA
jgi:CheY-like chemotaxis protein